MKEAFLEAKRGGRRWYRARRQRLHPEQDYQNDREQFLEKALESALTRLAERREPAPTKTFDESQVRKLQEQALSVQAEFDNFRKRTAREKEELRKTASSDFLMALMPALDSFDQAVGALEKDHDAQALARGVEAIHAQIRQTMATAGVEIIQPKGEAFDPNLHEALAVVKTDEQPENTVYDVFQSGYAIGGKLLRPARVRIAQKP